MKKGLCEKPFFCVPMSGQWFIYIIRWMFSAYFYICIKILKKCGLILALLKFIRTLAVDIVMTSL